MPSYFQIAYVYSKGRKIIWHAWLESRKFSGENVRLKVLSDVSPHRRSPHFLIFN